MNCPGILWRLAWVIALTPVVSATRAEVPAASQRELVAVEDLVAVGFSRSRVVIINEGHSDLRRCKRCRLIGRLILTRAHALGVRHFAVEALDAEFATSANRDRELPAASEGYLAQTDMRALLRAALDLGWTLVAYDSIEEGADQRHPETMNRREEGQARNLTTALAALPDTAKLLVWCGNSHLLKVEKAMEGGHPWVPMGRRFWTHSGIEPFTISQILTVNFRGSGSLPEWVAPYEERLEASPARTLGFLVNSGEMPGLDAVVISLDNELE